MQLRRHSPIAVAGPLGADLLDTFDEPRLLDRLACRLVIVGRPREPHQPASFGDRETTGPVMTDVVSPLGRAASREAPFKNSFSSTSLPTRRSSAAMRASWVCTMSAATTSLSKEPASYLATQMRTRLRLISWRLARPCRVSPARYSCATWRLNSIG